MCVHTSKRCALRTLRPGAIFFWERWSCCTQFVYKIELHNCVHQLCTSLHDTWGCWCCIQLRLKQLWQHECTYAFTSCWLRLRLLLVPGYWSWVHICCWQDIQGYSETKTGRWPIRASSNSVGIHRAISFWNCPFRRRRCHPKMSPHSRRRISGRDTHPPVKRSKTGSNTFHAANTIYTIKKGQQDEM